MHLVDMMNVPCIVQQKKGFHFRSGSFLEHQQVFGCDSLPELRADVIYAENVFGREEAAALAQKIAALGRMLRAGKTRAQKKVYQQEFRGEALLDSNPAAASAFLLIALPTYPGNSRLQAGAVR